MRKLGWPSLADPRKDVRLTFFYEIVYELVAVPTQDILIKLDPRTHSTHDKEFTYRYIPS